MREPMDGLLKLGLATLRFLPAEPAHDLGIRCLAWLQRLWFRGFQRSLPPAPGKAPAVVVAAPRFRPRNRVGIAAGLDKQAECYAALGLLGAGFVEVGTVTPQPQAGNAKPRLWRHPKDRALVNAFGFNSVGADRFEANLRRYRDVTLERLPVLANVGKNKATPDEFAHDDYTKLFRQLENVVDGFVVNLSSPNTPGLRNLQNTQFLEQIARAAPPALPVFVKFSPDLSDGELRTLCEYLRGERRFAGAVVGNTSRRLAEERYRAQAGGLSGGPLFPRAQECVGIAREALGPEKLLIGVGGIVTTEAARRMKEAGADLVELYTGFIYGGPRFLRDVAAVVS